jgi:itaconate CoA-transferase
MAAKARRTLGVHSLHSLGVFPSPLWGGVRGGGRAILSQVAPPRFTRTTPLPTPPPQGGREQTEFAALICSNIAYASQAGALSDNSHPMPLPLSGLLVVSLEQALAAPMCTCRLADAGARVIKVERPEGDFARYYDKLAVPKRPSPQPSPRKRGEGAHRASGETQEDDERTPGESGEGESAYFVWLNRGKESLVLDLARENDKALLAAIIAKADVFVQNLKPGAIAKLGFPPEKLRRAHPRLVICSISGYGEAGPYARRKAYDMLVQAESGLASITGGPEAPARVGVSICDIAAGMNAYEAILEALFFRARSGEGAAISISMFDAMADWMAVPLIQYEGGAPPKRMGLAHTSIAPYGAFPTKDGADILISIQSDREWRVLAEKVLGDGALAADPAFATNVERVKRRAETDARVAKVFGAMEAAALTQKLAENDIAFARVNTTGDLATHPQLRRIQVATPSGPVSYPAPPARSDAAQRRYRAVPTLGAHTAKIWAEFMPDAKRS